MPLFVLGLNHKTAPLAVREAAAFTDAELPAALAALRAQVQEAAIVSTCNRTEIYAAAPASAQQAVTGWWTAARRLEPAQLAGHSYCHRERDCVRHAMRVAAGLDSMILGEPQILGQMKQAFQDAQAAGSVGPLLSRLFEHAFSLAKLVRSETEIGAHPVSVAFAGVTLARRIFADFARHTALLIGAGEMMQLAARHLAQQGIGRMIFANRTLAHAQKLAAQYHAYAIPLEDLPAHLGEADLLLSCTASPEPVVTLAQVTQALAGRRHKPVFMLDLAVPRDIEAAVGKLEDIYLYTVDDLKDVIQDNLRSREAAARDAEGMIEARSEAFMRWLEARDAAGTIAQLRGRAEAQAEEVLARARRMLAQGATADEALAFLAQGLTNKLLHQPSTALRQAEAAQQTALLDAAQRLFGLNSGDHDEDGE
ncbi:MAG: glutamyl-tRNA reductase [Nevskiales bacterium]